MAEQREKVNRNMKKNVKQSSLQSEGKNYYLWPILFVIAILPLIVKIHKYSTGMSSYKWFLENDTYFDFYLYYKQYFLILTVFIMIIFTGYKAYKDRKTLKFTYIFIPLSIYGLFALLSSILSKYRKFSFTGSFEQFESVLVLLSYCFLVYYAYNFVKTEHDLKLIVYCILASVAVLSLIGISQITNNDFYYTSLGWRLITNSTYRIQDFNFVAGLNTVYLSLYNPNYVGVYISLILPVLFFLFVLVKKLWLKLVCFLAIIGLSISLYGSKSTTGLIAIIFSVVLGLLLLWRYLIKYYYISIPFAIVCIIGIFVVNMNLNNYFGNQINKIQNIQKSTPALTELESNDSDFVVKYNGNTLKVTFSIDEYGICNFMFVDENNNFVTSTIDTSTGAATITDTRFPGFVFTPAMSNNVIGFDANVADKIWFITNQLGDHSYYYLNPFNKYDKFATAPSAVFTGYEAYASGRGYIWSRTIPLLKNKIFLGSGADTFVFEFPQNDYVNMYNYGFLNQTISKPHCLYLQIATQTGVVSLIAFLVFYIMYFISSIRIYIKCKYEDFFSIMGAAIFIGTFGYMISGIANDSTITVAPVYWTFMGIGLAINYKLKKVSTASEEKVTQSKPIVSKNK